MKMTFVWFERICVHTECSVIGQLLCRNKQINYYLYWQLLKDKTALADKVAAINRRLDSQNQAWQHKLDTELVRMKETTLAGEKIRRERWVRENTKKIKVRILRFLGAPIAHDNVH